MSLNRFPHSHGHVALPLILSSIVIALSLAFYPTATPGSGPVAGSSHPFMAAATAATAFDAVPADAAPEKPTFCSAAYSYNGDDELPMVFMDASRGESVGYWDSENSHSLQRLQKTEKGRFLWFRWEGDEYVIRDARLMDRAEEIIEPQSKLGRAQGELGSVQGRMGKEQGALGARQGEYGRRLGDLARREAALQAKLHRRSLSASEEARLEAALERVRSEREEAQAAMQTLGQGQARMGAKQAALGQRQAELGRRQAELSRQVTRDLKALIREAMRDGRAIRLGAESY